MQTKPALMERMGKQVLLSDGSIGTELQRMGLEPGGCGELWNTDHPEKIKSLHHAYLQAGAELLTTNTFRGNRFALSQYGLESRVEEINRKAAELAREIADDKAWVMGSIGPLGGFLEPLGDTSAHEAFDCFVEQARALLKGGVDVIVIETMMAIEETQLAIRAAREAGAPFIISTMTFAKVKDGYRTLMGVSVEQAVAAMTQADADVIGCNCGSELTMEDHAAIVARFRARSDKPIIVQPNAGTPELVGAEIVYKQTPEKMAAKVSDLVQAGANIVGGCCGTTPDHIRAFKHELAKR